MHSPSKLKKAYVMSDFMKKVYNYLLCKSIKLQDTGIYLIMHSYIVAALVAEARSVYAHIHLRIQLIMSCWRHRGVGRRWGSPAVLWLLCVIGGNTNMQSKVENPP